MKYFLLLSISFFTLFASEAFITPSELKNSLKDNNLIIIDVSSTDLYNISHIKGAINFNVNNLIDKNPENKYPSIKPPQVIQKHLRKLGINKDSKVVIYSHNTDIGFLDSSFLAFILLYSSFENISILDGGYMAWVFENERFTSTQVPNKKDEGNIVVKINKNLIVDLNYVHERLASITMLDARSEDLYYGITRSNNIVGLGHIPYAKSSFYKNKFLNDITLRDKEELNEIYLHGYDLNIHDEVIVYSDNIFSASMEFYILYKEMGFKNAKLYKASLLEWGNKQDLPMTRFKWE